MDNVGSLQEQALKRKERLKNLRKKQVREDDEDDASQAKRKAEEVLDGDEVKKPVFKNYKPEDDTLQEHVLPKQDVPKVEEQVQDQLKAAVAKPVVEEVDISNLAPRKPDWDLKRDVAKKLEKLERRTHRAIAELIRERLQSAEESEVLAALASNAEGGEPEKDTDNSDSD
ncbi:coiled-coil domain-containing protein 12-like [Diadema setosum]|uniref:coiled-coil domain-containing protein 12-like n=1 Tax=Diadema setosum TaxID=31175 RepID=UPI003B3AF5BD